ncbi:pentapeptide repeat-containing protein [Miniimonas sp. S16]|uniref:pentapeptide repeat-containing protein n=1 Tax=Miniimonas sp. S16 TaxID=2171623 RepID=UPI00131F0A5F|nr:pentapeptide repeat-containing protein [Miniimonas sp. S16]
MVTPRRPAAVRPPAVEPVLLPDLTVVDPAGLHPHAELEGVRIALDAALDPDDALDASHAEIFSSELSGLRAARVAARGARLRETRLTEPDVTVLDAPASDWRDAEVLGGRFGSADLHDGELRRVRFVGVRLRYLNLRAARLADVELRDCIVDELDLVEASAERVALPGSRVGRLDLQHARLVDVDLRGCDIEEVVGPRWLAGAVVDSAQLMSLAPALATAVGLRVVG